ncbi:MAG TPA: type II toxin-antitoxin system VapC family toxin [Pyrinomonadaceae bacterium]|nr:type II toxin-antitoxin system VapC family toxin [Pyrinomonadaceae bacterium]
MPEFIIDTNILIGVLRGDRELASFVESLDCAIDTTIYVELIQGAKNKADVASIERALGQFQLFHFDESISRRTIDLIRSYSKSHGLMFGDAVIAATCLENDLKLVTFNVKDFRFIKGLRIKAPKL